MKGIISGIIIMWQIMSSTAAAIVSITIATTV
jgi:hypothetical protein